jgi:hypothetical protein
MLGLHPQCRCSSGSQRNLPHSFVLDLYIDAQTRFAPNSNTKADIWLGQSWVIRVILTAGGSLPVYPGKQTFWSSVGMSQRCHNRMYQLSALPPDPHPRIAVAGFTRKSHSLGATRSCCSHIGGVSPSRPTRQARPCNVPSGCLAAMMRTFAPGLRSLMSPGT